MLPGVFRSLYTGHGSVALRLSPDSVAVEQQLEFPL
jgi:hypothetical protein